MYKRAVAMCLVFVAVAVSVAIAQHDTGSAEASLDDLLKLREEKLADILDRYQRAFQVDIELVNDARERLFLARLETAKAKDRRIALLKERVEFLKQFEKQMEHAVKAGSRTPMQLLLTEVEVLEAEIALARESAPL